MVYDNNPAIAERFDGVTHVAGTIAATPGRAV
jgi:hypothetical protein